jgi:hypothetical protein
MTVLRCSINDPRLDWGVSRSFYGFRPDEQPAGYTAYLILWDAEQHGADWFKQNGEEFVSFFECSDDRYPACAAAFVAHHMSFRHHDVSAKPSPLTDDEVIRLACQRLKRPINFGEAVAEWQSVQEELPASGFCVFYTVLFLRAQGDRYLLTLAEMCRSDDEMFDSTEKITPAALREEDECAQVSAPQGRFRAEYCRALRQVYAFDARWRTATVMSIARGISEERDFHLMPILADALQEAGCHDDGVLTHCRGVTPEERCRWVLDVILWSGEPGASPKEEAESVSPGQQEAVPKKWWQFWK